MRIKAGYFVATALLLSLSACAGQSSALPATSLVIARPTASPETFPLQFNAAVGTANQALERVLSLLADRHYFDDAWREEIVSAATLADLGYRQLAELIPPDNQREKHEAAVQALGGCQDLASFVLKGINNADKGPFDEVSARAEFCRTKLEVATRAPGSEEAKALPDSLEAARKTSMLTVLRDANLRGGPGTGFPRVATAAPGDRFTLTGRSKEGDWLRITGEKVKEAWIASFLARIDGDLEAVPVAP
jgi:hypothetical protein